MTLQKMDGPIIHTVNHSRVFEEVVDMYKSDILLECPLYIKFEHERCYNLSFLGEVLFHNVGWLIPILCPQTDKSVLPILGKYLVSRFLPVRIALPCIIDIGPGATIPQPV